MSPWELILGWPIRRCLRVSEFSLERVILEQVENCKEKINNILKYSSNIQINIWEESFVFSVEFYSTEDKYISKVFYCILEPISWVKNYEEGIWEDLKSCVQDLISKLSKKLKDHLSIQR